MLLLLRAPSGPWALRQVQNRRGRFWLECDYVLAGTLTVIVDSACARAPNNSDPEFRTPLSLPQAVAGKGYAAWATSPTLPVPEAKAAAAAPALPSGVPKPTAESPPGVPDEGVPLGVPTNCFSFGAYPLAVRARALVAPIPRLFVVGGLSAFVGYGSAAV